MKNEKTEIVKVGGLASNRSHLSSKGSRVGAFEVHLVQSCYNPDISCSHSLEEKGARHGGAPEKLDGAIVCGFCACAARGEARPALQLGSKGPAENQHTLLHSKLFTRRWPNVRSLLGSIG